MMTTTTVDEAKAGGAPVMAAPAAEREDEAGRIGRDAAALFTSLRKLDAADIEQLLAQIRAAADDLEVEMMGGEPGEDNGTDGLRGYYERTVR